MRFHEFKKNVNEDKDPCWTGYKRDYSKKKFAKGSCVKEESVEEGMRSVREGEPGIKRVTRKRVDDSTEVRYHVLDSDGVTRKIFDDLGNAKAWLSANRPDLHRD